MSGVYSVWSMAEFCPTNHLCMNTRLIQSIHCKETVYVHHLYLIGEQSKLLRKNRNFV